MERIDSALISEQVTNKSTETETKQCLTVTASRGDRQPNRQFTPRATAFSGDTFAEKAEEGLHLTHIQSPAHVHGPETLGQLCLVGYRNEASDFVMGT